MILDWLSTIKVDMADLPTTVLFNFSMLYELKFKIKMPHKC